MKNSQKVALVTGAGGGLGRALSEELVAAGVRVVGFGWREKGLLETAEKIGDMFSYFVVDISDADAVQGAFKQMDEQNLRPDILINNAAIYERGDFLTTPPKTWMRAIDVNFGGIVFCTYEALQRMMPNSRGRIVNVASFADLGILSGSTAYSVSKGVSKLFTNALKADLGDRYPNIIVNDWVPGALNTKMGIPEGIEPALAAKWGAALALMENPESNYSIFFQQQEQLPARSLKGRIRDLVLLNPQRAPVMLAQ